jgi:hypothetical protein
MAYYYGMLRTESTGYNKKPHTVIHRCFDYLLQALSPKPGTQTNDLTSTDQAKPNEWKQAPKGKTVSQRILLPSGYDLSRYADDRKSMKKPMVGFHLSGPCPVCEHQTTAVCATSYLANEQTPDPERRDRTQTTALKCACVEDHTSEQAPAPLSFGCGAEWLLKVSWSRTESQIAVKKEVVTEEEAMRVWAAADANGVAIPSTLATYQAVAGKWQTALTAIVALVGVGSLLAGHTTFQMLSAPWQVGFAVALAVAIIGNGAVLWTSDLASFGFPTLRHAVASHKELYNSDLAPLKLAKKAQTQMWWSFGFAIPTIAASIAAVSIFLF